MQLVRIYYYGGRELRRGHRRRATIALTPHDPWALADAFAAVDPSSTTWRRFYDAMHATSLVAL